MTPPTAPERCPTCDRLRPASPREKIREWARSDLTLREIEERDGMCIESGSSMCAPRAVDWRARALAAEAQWAKVAPLIERLREVRHRKPGLAVDALDALLAATEATP